MNMTDFKAETMGAGAVAESLNLSLQKVLDNIADRNTKATALREITLKIKFKPGEDREDVSIVYETNERLASRRAIEAELTLDTDLEGKNIAFEHTKGDNRTMDIPGFEEKPDNVSDFAALKKNAK